MIADKVSVTPHFQQALFRINKIILNFMAGSCHRTQHGIVCYFMFIAIQLFVYSSPQFFQGCVAPIIRHGRNDCSVQRMNFSG